MRIFFGFDEFGREPDEFIGLIPDDEADEEDDDVDEDLKGFILLEGYPALGLLLRGLVDPGCCGFFDAGPELTPGFKPV